MKLAYRQAQAWGKIKTNPTRLVRQRKENNERIRYLSDAEEIKLRAVMVKEYAERIPDFEIALMTGMRMSEQLTLEWNEIDLAAGTIHLDQTKNGSSRFVRLNSRALAIMKMLYGRSVGSGRVFIAKRGIGSVMPSRKRASKISLGIVYATRSPAVLSWRELISRRCRN